LGNSVAPLSQAIREFFRTHAPKGSGLVAVSGGADSVAMLRAFAELGMPATVGHVNHQLRGAESDGDEAFVIELAAQLNLHCLTKRVVLPAGNLENAARTIRYETLTEFAVQSQCQWIATAHTADDQAETILHRLIRGTGLTGLRGIAEVRGLITRPLLNVSRAEVLEYLQHLNQPFRTDSSNADLGFTRNRIRAELVPLLKTFNPQIVDVLGRVAEQAHEAVERLDSQADQLLAAAELPRAGNVLVFDVNVLSLAPPAVVRDLFRRVWQRESWAVDGMTHAHWHRVAALTVGDYPAGVTLKRVGRVVQLGIK